jgi:aquaporin Z
MDILKHLVELIGTALFVYVILNVTQSKPPSSGFSQDKFLGPVTIVLTLLAMIIIFGNVSGGHFNPAVSVAKFMDGSIDMTHLVGFAIMQVLGALLAFKFWQMTRV